MKSVKIIILGTNLLILFALAAVTAGAQNLIVNGSFESGTFTQNGAFANRMELTTGSTAVTGWTVSEASGNFGYLWWLQGPDYNAQDGNRAIDLDSNGNLPGSYVEQTFATVPGIQYEVSGYFASEANGGPAVTTIQINGNVIGTSSTGSGNYGGTSFNNMVWTPETFDFTATSASSTLRLQDATTANGPNGYNNPVIDNIAVQAVPEPSTGLLLSLGLGGFARFYRRSKARIA